MDYNIRYKKGVEKDLAHIAKADVRRIIDKLEKELSKRADAYPLLKGPFSGMRKLRVGDYRIIFAINEEEVSILRIGHRRSIYK
ncbi:MAG: type II toxin-antitoxin system RelE/ParE family toxin [Candidatus Sumerlaeota bacterium]|nr:type II toxin-antitoxin system RelE/ParE family toxin [Candidatus Sumerlaeota bacterium]